MGLPSSNQQLNSGGQSMPPSDKADLLDAKIAAALYEARLREITAASNEMHLTGTDLEEMDYALAEKMQMEEVEDYDIGKACPQQGMSTTRAECLASKSPTPRTTESAHRKSTSLMNATNTEHNCGHQGTALQPIVPPPAVADVLRERGQRLQTEKKKQVAEEKAAREAKAEARKAIANPAESQRLSIAQQKAKEKMEERVAKQEVLAKIERDKVERKRRDREEKEARHKAEEEEAQTKLDRHTARMKKMLDEEKAKQSILSSPMPNQTPIRSSPASRAPLGLKKQRRRTMDRASLLHGVRVSPPITVHIVAFDYFSWVQPIVALPILMNWKLINVENLTLDVLLAHRKSALAELRDRLVSRRLRNGTPFQSSEVVIVAGGEWRQHSRSFASGLTWTLRELKNFLRKIPGVKAVSDRNDRLVVDRVNILRGSYWCGCGECDRCLGAEKCQRCIDGTH